MPVLPVVLAGGAKHALLASQPARGPEAVRAVGRPPYTDRCEHRTLRLLAPAAATVVSAQELASATRGALRAHRGTRLLLEPLARNTAAAIAWAAAEALGRGDRGVIGVFPADHYIPDARAFARSVRTAATAAADGERLVLLGIEPSRPDTAYGYLRLTRGARAGVARVARFVEKPDAARARPFSPTAGICGTPAWCWRGRSASWPRRRSLSPEVWDALGPTLEQIAAGRRVPRRALARSLRRGARSRSTTPCSKAQPPGVRLARSFRWSDLRRWDALGTHRRL